MELLASVTGNLKTISGSNGYTIKEEIYLKSQEMINGDTKTTLRHQVFMRTNANNWGWSAFTSPKVYVYKSGSLLAQSGSIKKLPTNNANNWVQLLTYDEAITHNTQYNAEYYARFQPNTNEYSFLPAAGNTSIASISVNTLHTPPSNVTYTMQEANQKVIDAGISENVIVANMSIKKLTVNAELHDGAIAKRVGIYNRLHFKLTETNTLPLEVLYDFYERKLQTAIDWEGVEDGQNKAPISVMVDDSFDSAGYSNNGYNIITSADYYNFIPYERPTIIETSTTVKRNGQTSGKVKLYLNGGYYNDIVGNKDQKNNYKPTIKYKYWKFGTEEPIDYDNIISSEDIVVNDGNVTVIDYEIGSSTITADNYFNPNFAYRVKFKIEDSFYSTESEAKSITVGEPTWSEYKDRVDFKKITIKGKDILNLMYPIGCVYCTQTPNNPNELLGTDFEWELVDKEFKHQYIFKSNTAIGTLNGLSAADVRVLFNGRSIQLEFNATTKTNITDSEVTLLTINRNVIGLVSSPETISYRYLGFSDGGNNVFFATYNSNTGVMKTVDAVGDGSHKISSGQTIYWTQTIYASRIEDMLDSFCDKFYWKRREKPQNG